MLPADPHPGWPNSDMTVGALPRNGAHCQITNYETLCTITSAEPTSTAASVRTSTVPSSTRPAAGAALAVTAAGTVQLVPDGRFALASLTATAPNAGLANTSTYLYVVEPDGPANPTTSTVQVPAAGLLIGTDSSALLPALVPACTQVPVVQLNTARSRSARASDGLPIVARSEVEPGMTFTGNCCCAPLSIFGVSILALPRAVPAALPVNPTRLLARLYCRLTGVPMVADEITSGFGVTVAPSTDAEIVYGAAATSEVRRASITISQTPGVGLVTVRLVGLPPAHAPPAGGGL